MDNWITEYEHLMFAENQDKRNLEAAAKIKFGHMPEKLYKYRCLCPTHIEALEKGQLFASSIIKLDDYKESNFCFTEGARARVYQKVYNNIRKDYGLPEATVSTPFDIFNLAEEKLKREAQELYPEQDITKKKIPDTFFDLCNEIYEALLETSRNQYRLSYTVCCFSASNKIDSMWGHYSDCSKGFCVEYEFKKMGILHDDVQLMMPVIYCEDNRVFIDNIDDIDGNISMHALCLKEKGDWEIQKEWRRFYPYRGKDSEPKDMPKPSAIYLGVNAEKNTPERERLDTFCRTNEIPIYQMIYNVSINDLEPVRIK